MTLYEMILGCVAIVALVAVFAFLIFALCKWT